MNETPAKLHYYQASLKSTNILSVSAPAESDANRTQPAALQTIAEVEDVDIDGQDGNDDSNMRLASVDDQNRAAESHAGRFDQDDVDDNEDFG
ncbi:hypothetical protein FRC04_000635 [Tulasnella sp. 424]|nr:hypothetical protein FRC04_000635 [Tulasnella sp. 424]